MKYNKFKQIIEDIIEQDKKFEKFSDAIGLISPDTYIPYINTTTIALDIFIEHFNDESDWISYWMYDLDCGNDYKTGSVKDNGKNVKLRTIKDLYNILTK